MADLSNKIAVVTGGRRGIGRAIADHDGCTALGQQFGNRASDVAPPAGHHRDFIRKVSHSSLSCRLGFERLYSYWIANTNCRYVWFDSAN